MGNDMNGISSHLSDVRDEEEIMYTSEWLKQNTTIHGWLWFFLFVVIIGGLVSAIFPIVTYNSEDYGDSLWLGASDIASGLILFGVAVYTVYLFVTRKPNAVFFGITYVILIFLSDILTLLTGGPDEVTGIFSEKHVVRSVIWCVAWFLYLIFSEQVKEIIPKPYRKVSKRDWGILAAIILIPLSLLMVGVVQTYSHVNLREKQESELLHRELSYNERTDGLVVFTIPKGFVCDDQDIDLNGTSITIFNIENDEGTNGTMCSDYDNDTSDSNFDSYWENWKEDGLDKYPAYDVSRRRRSINDNTCLYRITKFYIDGVYVYWRYYMLFNQETGKVFVASLYDINDSTDYIEELLHSVQFK